MRNFPARNRAKATVRIGKHARLAARVDITTPGLLAVGTLVSLILLSTAVLARRSLADSGCWACSACAAGADRPGDAGGKPSGVNLSSIVTQRLQKLPEHP